MGRSEWTDDDIAPSARNALEHPPERLQGGSRGRPAVALTLIVSIVAVLVWQPWTTASKQVEPSGAPAPASAVADASRALAPSAAASGSALPSPDPLAGRSGTLFYTSITDHEWTVVALLTLGPAASPSTEEPATQHGTGAAGSPAGPFLVLQQGVIPLGAPVKAAGGAGGPCAALTVPRDRSAVPLPAGRVAYLGVTFPDTIPRPVVTAALTGGSAGLLTRSVAPTVELAGMGTGRRYVIPSSGPGGAILFAPTAPGALPPGTYELDIASPGAAGDRYVYACVGP